MTEEYKIEILNYLLGKVQTTSSDDSEIFLEQEDIDRSTWKPFLPGAWNNFRFEGMVAPNETTSSLGVLYGGYTDTSGNPRGIIVLVNENFVPVKTIYKNDANSELRYIQYMKQAEDGTFYYIDSNNFSYRNAQKTASNSQETRLVMVNNFTIKDISTNDYSVKYRKTYVFGGTYKNFYCKNMFKDTDSSTYILFGMGGALNNSSWSYRVLKIIGIKINVGSPNEWTSYVNENNRLFGSAIATFENENPKFRCISCKTTNANRTVDLIGNYGGSIGTLTVATFSYQPYVDDENYKKQSVFLNDNEVYFVQNNQRWGVEGTAVAKHIGLYKYNISAGTLTEIYHKSLGSYDFCNIEAIYIDRCISDIYVQYVNNIDRFTSHADYYFQRLVNDTWSPILIAEDTPFNYDRRSIYVKANFNLLQIYLYMLNPQTLSWYQHLIKEDYNVLNYNGTPYIDYDSLISQKGQIYSNEKLVFARNLYNRTLNGGTTVSTIQVPNNYLNGVQLDLKKLISQTNFDINNDINITDKNIYETVFVNYINTINVLDEDTQILYPTSASYINSNINTGTSTNCSNKKMSKVRINYSDNSEIIETLEWQQIDGKNYQCNFVIDTSVIPLSIDFISDDENTIYLTKTLDLEENKTYLFNQKLRIE